MLQIAVCDDTPEDLSIIMQQTKKYLSVHGLEANVEGFSHPDALLTASEKKLFHLYLLDIVMPMMNGIEVGRMLRKHHNGAQIIYLTTSDEFAVEAFSLQAVHYLIKPFTGKKLDDALQRAIDNLSSPGSKGLVIRTEAGELRTVNVDAIQYIESRCHTQQVHFKNEIIIEKRRSLARLFEELQKVVKGSLSRHTKGSLLISGRLSP
ncbi:MAG: LytTR family DNA-binding domain-containing protein [Eubacteriaceae bacterium]|jgi:DNA-binding LytR/AlgR family response regulator|nr:LytTR family DNA-binding domain-containing protein [Eubacteriaceae bacterium]MDD4507412.1 LytTR family DNA-binding domain-containing protein [Eubacteriaceae bacterium]